MLVNGKGATWWERAQCGGQMVLSILENSSRIENMAKEHLFGLTVENIQANGERVNSMGKVRRLTFAVW